MITLLRVRERVGGFSYILSYAGASGSEMTPGNKLHKPLVVDRFFGNIMTSITTLHTKL